MTHAVSRLFFVLAILGTLTRAALAAQTIPDTEAGKRLGSFLRAFNSGQREKLREFIAKEMDPPPNAPSFVADVTERHFGLYRQTGGFTVGKVEESGSARIRILAQAKRTGVWMRLSVFVEAKAPEYIEAVAPYRVVGMGFNFADAPEESLPKQPLTDPQIAEKVGVLMRVVSADDGFAGVVYVARHGKPVYAKAFGMASKGWKTPNRLDTRFNLASITKMFTAVAVAQLVEQGKLSFEDPVGKVLPGYANKGVAERVTIHHLLSHTSGMIGARELVEKGPQGQTRTIDEMVKQFVNEPLTFTPGERFQYSNAGFILLGAVIEKVSGQTYFDYVRDHIFRSAGMKDTDFLQLDLEPANVATGYEDGPGGKRVSNIFALNVIGSPAGGAYATAPDMVRFHLALMQGRLVREATRQRLWTENKNGYGYGAQPKTYNGQRIIGHGGGWRGITNALEFFPELGYTVVVLSNYDVEPAMIANKLHEWIGGGR